MILIVCNTNIIAKGSSINVGDNILSALGRVPCFIIGLGLGQASKDGERVSLGWVLLLSATYFVIRRLLGITNGTEWMMVPLILTVFIAVIRLFKNSWLDVVLNIFGKISLESYLTNITINSILCVLIPTYLASPLFYGRWIEYSFVILVGIAVAFGVNRISERIIKIK